NHQRGLREATLVASVARRLHEQARAARPDAIYLPNAVEYERFANPTVDVTTDPEVQHLLKEGRPVAGYYGALASWFDYDLLESVAGRRPDWNFLLIGPNYDESLVKFEKGAEGGPFPLASWHKLLQRPNVYWLTPRDYVTLPGYLQLFSVAMIPFAIND